MGDFNMPHWKFQFRHNDKLIPLKIKDTNLRKLLQLNLKSNIDNIEYTRLQKWQKKISKSILDYIFISKNLQFQVTPNTDKNTLG